MKKCDLSTFVNILHRLCIDHSSNRIKQLHRLCIDQSEFTNPTLLGVVKPLSKIKILK
jgi:hypothetical protein